MERGSNCKPLNHKEAADNTLMMASRDITRVGLQGDMYAVAEPENLTRMLEELKIETAGLWAPTVHAQM